jgi:hypothetical protein
MRKSLGNWLRRLGYALVHLAHRIDPVKGPFECPRCGGQGNILVRSAQQEGFVRQTCAFCKGRGSVMDRRSGIDRRRPNQQQPQAQATEGSSEPSASAPAPAAVNPNAGE